MCGIVMVGGGSLLETHVSFFESLLHADVVRGKHSTGVFRSMAGGGTGIYKEAVPGPAYLETKGWSELRGENNTQYQKDRLAKEGKPIPTALSNFYVGHNRYATQGAINSKNAHPFKHGKITLVHNGTLRGQWRLPDHKDFEVDSENICHSIDKIGIDETVQKLQGAFTLIWHNEEEQTLNIIRNTERPFYLMEFSNGMWAGASEKEMIQWLNNRRKATMAVKNEFEIPVGEQHIFDVSNGGFKLKEVRKHELPRFPYSYTSQKAWWEDDDYYASRYGSSATKTTNTKAATTQSQKGSQVTDANTLKVNEILAASGISSAYRKDKKIQFWPYEFREYLASEPNRGSIRGWTMDAEGIYLEVELHALTRKVFDDIPSNTLCETTIASAYFEKSKTKDEVDIKTPVAIGRGIELVEEDEEEDVNNIDLTAVELSFLNDDIPPFDITIDACEICNSPLEDGKVYVEEDDLKDTQVFCETCNTHYGLRGTLLITPQTEDDVEEEVGDEVVVTEVPSLETDEPEKGITIISKEGGDSAEVPKKTLSNGWCVTKKEWESDVGYCGFCNVSIPWDEAETTELLYQTQPCCTKHYEMLMGES